MRIDDAVRRPGVAVTADDTVQAAAALMERAGVGAVPVLDKGRIIGIVTDRDLVRRVLAKRLPSDARVDAVMTAPAITIAASEDVRAAYPLFRDHAIRRLVVEEDGRLVGIVSVDDLVIDLAADLADLARPVTAEAIFGHRDAAVPAPRAPIESDAVT